MILIGFLFHIFRIIAKEDELKSLKKELEILF